MPELLNYFQGVPKLRLLEYIIGPELVVRQKSRCILVLIGGNVR